MDLTTILDWLKMQGNLGVVLAFAIPLILGALGYKKMKPGAPSDDSAKPKLDLDALLRSQGIKLAGVKAALSDVPAWLHKALQFEVCDPVAAADHKKSTERVKELEDNKLV